MLRVLAYAPEPDKSRNWPCHHAMVRGLSRHGLDVEERRIGPDPWEPADIIVMNGWRKPGRTHTEVIDRQIEYGGRLLIMDRGYFSRKIYWSVGWGGINGRADHCNAGKPSDRWDRMQKRPGISDWRRDGDHIVIMGQVESDAAVVDVDFGDWVVKTAEAIRQVSDREIYFRPHPRARGELDVGLDIIGGDIHDALRGAWAAVTYNSTSAVDAVLAGIPVFAADVGSIAWPVANKKISEIEAPGMPDRRQWLHDTAYAQWTLPEIASGEVWEQMRTGL